MLSQETGDIIFTAPFSPPVAMKGWYFLRLSKLSRSREIDIFSCELPPMSLVKSLKKKGLLVRVSI